MRASSRARYPLVVIKRGAAGCEAAAGAKRWRVDAPKIEAIDTTGAGDAFVAAFLAARLAGAPIGASRSSAPPRRARRRRKCSAAGRRRALTRR